MAIINVTKFRDEAEKVNKHLGRFLASSLDPIFKELGTQRAVKEDVSRKRWTEVINNGLKVLRVNPWDVSTLTALATACKNLAVEGDAAVNSGFAECSLFYEKCAADASS